MSQQSVTSKDGTAIAYWTSGKGPPLVLVHGTPDDHTRWRPLLPYLESHTTVHAMDRRGRGGSGDGPQYTLEREYEDVAAVVDAVAEGLRIRGRRLRSLPRRNLCLRRGDSDVQHPQTRTLRGMGGSEPRGLRVAWGPRGAHGRTPGFG